MEQSEDFVDPDHPDGVWKILHSMYGLKQSPRQWNIKLHKFLICRGLKQSSHDPAMYYSLSGRNLNGLVGVHLDDLAVTGFDDFIVTFGTELKKSFEILKEEPLKHFLSLLIQRKN